MKKNIIYCILSVVMFLTINNTIAQNGVERCTTMEALQQRIDNNQRYANYYELTHATPKQERSGQIPCDGTNSIVVPVAFHFAPGTVTCGDVDCVLEEVLDQLDAMNQAFGDNNAASANVVAGCPGAYEENGASVVSTGTCISFCMAIPPAGNAQGLDPACDPPITIGEFTGGFGAGGQGAPGWNGIMNMFIVGANNCLGVADGIPGAGNGDGVSTCAQAFGGFDPSSGCGLDTDGTYNLGATMIHEIGHYLGLYHTFQGGCGDEPNGPGPFNVDDTPPAANPYFGCNIAGCNASGCGNDQAIGNFMDYTDDACMTMFSEDQAAVMNYWANQLFSGSASQCSDPNPTVLTTQCENTTCVVACATAVTTPVAITDDFCEVSSAIAFPNPEDNGLVLDDNSDAVYTWSTGNYLSAGGTTIAAPNTLTSANCSIETETYYLNVDCATTPLHPTLDGGTYIITVYPGPPADLTTLVTVSGEDTCNEPILTPLAGCESFVTITPDAGNPTFPVNNGDSGAASYTVAFTPDPNGPDCCLGGNPDDEGEILVNGDFEAGVGPWVELEEVPAGTPNPNPYGIIGVSGGQVNGSNDAWFGGWGGDSYLTITQDITIPDCNVVELSFDYLIGVCGAPSDYLEVQIGGVVVANIPCDDTNSTFGPVDVLALGVAPGATQIVIIGEENSGANTNFFVDNVSLVSSDCTVPLVCDVPVTANYNCSSTGVPYCDDPCFVEYNPTPGPDDTPDAAECVTALDCTNGTSTMQACDDADPCTENDMESVLDCDNTVVCVPCAGTPVATCTLPSVAQACDDGDPCTENDMEEVDACDATVVCVPCAGTPVAACSGATNMVACDDGDPCTTGEMEEIDACDNTTVCVPCGNGMAVTPACGDPNATNYDMNATCIDNTTCTYGMYCDNPCYAEYAPSPGPGDTADPALCVTALGCADLAGIDPSCITIGACDDGDPCTANEEATTIVATGNVCADCGLNSTPVSPACGDPTADNYDPAATCIDNTLCVFTCEDAIAGTVFTDNAMCPPPGSDFGGISVTIIDAATGMAVAGSPVLTDAMGNYNLPGPFPCGQYTAELDPTTVPVCYASLDGEVGPLPFSVNGDGTADGADFSNIVMIPTLSQWGLMILALLLMSFGAIKISAFRRAKALN